ncbi:MAG TPA: dolichyl-phosphate-mannose--protein mannosyltransferase, partial [Clostridia bacterium]
TGTQGNSRQGMPGNPPGGNNIGAGPGGSMQPPPGRFDGSFDGAPNRGFDGEFDRSHTGNHGGPGDGNSGLAGTFGNQTPAGITRLFSKNVLSDQIVWFIPIALLGFIAAAFKEKLRFVLNNNKKQALVLWFMWFFPEFIYFSFNTGLFHSYYLTMMAPPIAALTGIGIVSMWDMYKNGGWKSWFLPLALFINGAIQLLVLSYFFGSSELVKIFIAFLIGLCFTSVLVLSAVNLFKKKESSVEESIPNTKSNRLLGIKKILLFTAVAGLLVSPLAGSAAAMFHSVGTNIPVAGLELMSSTSQGSSQIGFRGLYQENTTDLIKFLNSHTVNGKSQIVAISSNTAESLILNSNLYVGSLSGFAGNEKVMSLGQFKEKVKSGDIRYILTNNGGDHRDSSNSEILTWVKENGKLVSYASADSNQNSSEQLYDLSGSMK